MKTYLFPTLYNPRGRHWKISIKIDKLNRGFITTQYGPTNLTNTKQIKYKTPSLISAETMYKKIYQLAETKWKNKQRLGYSTKATKTNPPGTIILPMLAHDYTNAKYSHRITFPAYVQIKYDGYRALTDLSKCLLLTRRMNPIPNVDHIIAELQQIKVGGDGSTSNIYLDGELYLPEGVHQLKTALAKGTQKPVYYIFDMFDLNGMDMDFSERWNRLKTLMKSGGKYRYIKLVETYYPVKSAKEIDRYLQKFLKLGHEGLVVRNAAGLYKFGVKSADVQKLVEIKRGQFEIVGYKAGSDGGGDQVVWILKCHASTKTFCASPVGTHTQRRQLLKDADKYIGKKVTVKYFELKNTKDECVIRNPIVEM